MLARKIALIAVAGALVSLYGCNTVPAAFTAVGQGVEAVGQGLREDVSSMRQPGAAIYPDYLANSADLYGPGWRHIESSDPNLNPPVIFNPNPYYRR